ncbi:hypothetical protein LTR28_009892 [Elasticomyces elasticus]|nr:hypothetical protein LTR28_009892 [Elasticomyces elasticus]
MIQVAALQNAKCKRRMYWTTFYRFLGVHVWAAALTATLLWIFDASENALIMYLAYVGAYSGLLLYQYNKIFSGPHALIPLLSAFAIGFPIGLALRKVYPHSPWNNVIALAVGTWTAALFSLHTAKLTNERRPRALPAGDPGLFHACSGLGGERHWSQSELEAFYNAICLEPSDVRSVISEDGSLGRKIRAILLSRDHDSLSKLAQKAFPEASDIIRQILCAWKQGSMSVELVRARALSNPEADLIALSRTLDGTLHLLVVLDPHAKEIAYIVAEKMLHAFAETLCVFTNEASELQSLLRCGCDCDLYSEVARYDLGALAAINKYHFYRNCGRTGHGLTSKEKSHHRSVSGNRHTMYGGWEAGSISSSTPMIARLTAPLAASYHVFGTWIKFFFLAWMADVEYQRELDCTLGRKPYIIARPVGLSLNTIWTYAEAAQAAVLPLFLFHNRKDVRPTKLSLMLKPYWRKRDIGNLLGAEDYLALHADAVMASSELSNDISPWTPLAIKMSDLFSFGRGGDAVVFTRTKTLQADTDDSMHVIAVDTGTWPNEGGGVSACRRDMINNLRTIKWHMIAESANDFGLPKHQIEENVQSLKVVPLWGLDFLHPVHGMFANKLDSEVGRKAKDAKAIDVKLNFVPTLTALVKGTRAVNLSQADIEQATRALVNLNTYFQDSRHWSAVWTSDVVKESWRHLWLTDDMLNAKPSSERFDTEWPTLGHLDTALELWYRYLFVFSIPIPERVPSVFQASHHSVSASYGIVCKIKRQCTLQIWDHAISWRETNLYLSSALCTLPPFIRNSLLGLMRLTSTLVLHHADQILPCADFFNPAWETEIGTSQGTIEHRNAFKRKIDPIVNGIADMQKFEPVEEILTKKPTVTMLSHVWYAKDIKTALLAADIIINEWGFDDYHLDIYGALNKAPVYSSECQEIIASKGLAHSVILRGTADPAMVLASSWLFLNSSISEGLPLALGEAALTGAPVVCTDVGASLRVLTDQENDQRYSGVVAPNDPYALARAQINLLAMLDEWSLYAQDSPEHPAPVLKQRPTAEEVATITRRIYEKTPERRMLGMRARNIVQKSFSGERYLREHEQMLWIGRNEHEMRTDVTPSHLVSNSESTAHSPERDRAMEVSDEPIDLQLVKMAHPRRPYIRHPALGTSFSTVGDGVASPTRSLLSTYDDSTNDAGIAYLQKPEAAWLNFVRSER